MTATGIMQSQERVSRRYIEIFGHIYVLKRSQQERGWLDSRKRELIEPGPKEVNRKMEGRQEG